MPRAASGVFKTLALLVFLACPGLAFLAAGGDVPAPLRLALALPHAAIYFSLLWWFGRTLARGREPLITGVARRVHGGLAPEMETYTRRVTLAWCCFFAAQIIVSGSLFAFASFESWSFFANVLNLPLVALMFGAEYGYRVARYPDHPRASIAKALKVFAADDAAVTGAKAR